MVWSNGPWQICCLWLLRTNQHAGTVTSDTSVTSVLHIIPVSSQWRFYPVLPHVWPPSENAPRAYVWLTKPTTIDTITLFSTIEAEPGERIVRERMRQNKGAVWWVHGKPFERGDRVWLHCPAVPRGSPRKLHTPWKGPFRILNKLSKVTYRIRNIKKLSQKFR